jgi:hypothetical protein
MAASGFRGGPGGRDSNVIEGADRGQFIEDILNQFKVSRMPIDDELERWIQTEMFISERRWVAGLRSGRLDLRTTQTILEEALAEAGNVADSVGQAVLDLNVAHPAFERIIGAHGCPYPFKGLC